MTFMMESVLDDTPLHVYTAFQLVKLMILKPLSHRQRSLGSGLWVMVLAHGDTLTTEMHVLSPFPSGYLTGNVALDRVYS